MNANNAAAAIDDAWLNGFFEDFPQIKLLPDVGKHSVLCVTVAAPPCARRIAT